jgi:hypothetical protein
VRWGTFTAGSKRWGESVCPAAGKGKFGGGRKRFEDVILGERGDARRLVKSGMFHVKHTCLTMRPTLNPLSLA